MSTKLRRTLVRTCYASGSSASSGQTAGAAGAAGLGAGAGPLALASPPVGAAEPPCSPTVAPATSRLNCSGSGVTTLAFPALAVLFRRALTSAFIFPPPAALVPTVFFPVGRDSVEP